VESRVPIFLKADPERGIKRDCPIQLRKKEYKRKALVMLVALYTQQGFTDDQIIAKINDQRFDD
jgi:hypothetical protein